MMAAFIVKKTKQAGVSILEVIIGVAIFAVIALVVGLFQENVFSLNRVFSSSLLAQDEARKALKEMSSEMRVAAPSSIGAYALAQVTSTAVTFYANIDSDAYKEKVRYFLSGNILKKGVIKPSGNPLVYNSGNETIKDVVHYVTNGSDPVFYYYDANYGGTEQPLTSPVDTTAVRLIKINLAIDDNVLLPPSALILTTQVNFRNLKDNL